jgi:hypothetical protein
MLNKVTKQKAKKTFKKFSCLGHIVGLEHGLPSMQHGGVILGTEHHDTVGESFLRKIFIPTAFTLYECRLYTQECCTSSRFFRIVSHMKQIQITEEESNQRDQRGMAPADC